MLGCCLSCLQVLFDAPHQAFTLTRNVTAPVVGLFKSPLIASNNMSAPGATSYFVTSWLPFCIRLFIFLQLWAALGHNFLYWYWSWSTTWGCRISSRQRPLVQKCSSWSIRFSRTWHSSSPSDALAAVVNPYSILSLPCHVTIMFAPNIMRGPRSLLVCIENKLLQPWSVYAVPAIFIFWLFFFSVSPSFIIVRIFFPAEIDVAFISSYTIV